MKKSVLLILCLAIGMMFATSPVFAAYTPGAGISLTPHDLSNGDGFLYGDDAEKAGLKRICVYCHAPHNTMSSSQAAAAQITYFPLWNMQVTTQNYEMYTNGVDMPSNTSHQSQAMAYFDATGNTRPGSVSRLCLSCHDGTVATNSYGLWNGATSVGANNNNITAHGQPQFTIGGASQGSLSNHHPIGFPYNNAASVDNEIKGTDTDLVGAQISLKIGDLLWQGNMECTTCHDVHNSKNGGEKFLWVSDSQSKFCLTCHDK